MYGRHLSAGHGFVYNIGGEHVEGFTSLLWVLVSAMAFRITRAPEKLLLFLSVLVVAATACCLLWSPVIRRRSASTTSSLGWASIFLLLLFSDYRYVGWNIVSLMDNAVWSAALTLSAVALISANGAATAPRRLLTGLAVLLPLTRPEAFLWMPIIIGLAYRSAVLNGSTRSAAYGVARGPTIAFLVTVAALTTFRVSYFGYPLPNTFYAKVSPSLLFDLAQGGKYFVTYMMSGPVVFACMLSVGVSVVHMISAGPDPVTLTLTVFSVTGLLIPLLTGGDHFGGFRFYQNIYPLLLLTLLNWIRIVVPQYVTLHPHNDQHVARAGLVLLALAFLLHVALDWRAFEDGASLKHEFATASDGRARGAFAEQLFLGELDLPSLGEIAAGGVKYAYRGPVIDLMGLNSTRMAHNGGRRVGRKNHAAFEKGTFYELAPAVLTPSVVANGSRFAALSESFVTEALKGLPQDSDFQRLYTFAQVTRRPANGTGPALAAWYRRDFLRIVQSHPGFEVRAAAGSIE